MQGPGGPRHMQRRPRAREAGLPGGGGLNKCSCLVFAVYEFYMFAAGVNLVTS